MRGDVNDVRIICRLWRNCHIRRAVERQNAERLRGQVRVQDIPCQVENPGGTRKVNSEGGQIGRHSQQALTKSA